ncbi:MAG: hypothetical protein KW793_01865 [Candidatus Doudnabacteria bacterium]|nr:hypothetical protein [Candidatus Doudnabacteria bacterium]
MELTKEYFEKHLNDQLGVKLDAQTRELKAYTNEQTEELARIVNKGFEHTDQKFTPIEQSLITITDRLDVRDKIETFEKKFKKLENTLNIRL